MDGRSLENLEENVREQDEQAKRKEIELVFDVETGKFKIVEVDDELRNQRMREYELRRICGGYP